MPSVQLKKAAYDFMNITATGSISAPDLGLAGGPLAQLDFDEASYKTTIERTGRWGGSRQKQDETEGRADHEASIKVPTYWSRYLFKRCGELSIPVGYARLTLAFSYNKIGQPITTDTLFQCSFKEIAADLKEGNDHLMVTMPLSPMNIFWDGRDVFGGRYST